MPTKAIPIWLAAHRIRPVAVASTGSARSPVSSVRSRDADWMPNAAAMIAMNPISVAMNASVSPCWPPSLVIMSRLA